MHWTNLELFANAVPALLDDRWLLRITASRPARDATHALDVQLHKAIPPSVPGDFISLIWRIHAAGHTKVVMHAAYLPLDAPGGPAGPAMTTYMVFDPEVPWKTRSGRERRGCHFQLDILPVWRPPAKD